jgi:hypothetical protein
MEGRSGSPRAYLPEEASCSAVRTTEGVFPARLVGGAIDSGVAALELPEPARALEGARLAERPSGDHLLSIRASPGEGAALVYDVIGFSIKPSDDALRAQSAPGLPFSFAGAPVFDAGGSLEGLLVGPSGQEMVFVRAARLMQILARVHQPAPQDGNHI